MIRALVIPSCQKYQLQSWFVLFYCFSEAQAGLELKAALLSQSPTCWNWQVRATTLTLHYLFQTDSSE